LRRLTRYGPNPEAAVPTPDAGEEHLYLMSRSSLGDYLDFMTSWPVGAADTDRKQLAAEWKAADRVMDRFRESEPDFADVGPEAVRPLPAALQPLAARAVAEPAFRQAFADVEYQLGVVPLERLVVSQKLVSLRHIDRLKERLGPAAGMDDVFRCCLPFDRVAPPVRVSRISDDEFAFTSESNDLRFLDAALLRPDQLAGYQAVGPVAGVVALVVGFGVNYLHVLSVDGRLVLNNGHHRACGLYAAGVREVPCVVQTVTHPDELAVHAPRAVSRDRGFYLEDPRPPVLKDYFRPELVRRLRLALTTKTVRVRYSTEEMDMP
jgi:hypothetical protein